MQLYGRVAGAGPAAGARRAAAAPRAAPLRPAVACRRMRVVADYRGTDANAPAAPDAAQPAKDAAKPAPVGARAAAQYRLRSPSPRAT